MEERKRNKNALRSRALLRKAYLELMKTKKIDQITVTDIVRIAGLNRATFYAHYSCVRDIANELQGELTDELKKVLYAFQYDQFFANPTDLLLRLSIILGDDEDYYRTLVLYGEVDKFVEELQEIFVNYMMEDKSVPQEIKTTKSFKLRIYYFAGGIVNSYLQYFKGKLDCSIYDIPLVIANTVKADFNASDRVARN